MRRKDREITDYNEKVAIIQRCEVCRLGMIDGDSLYIVPLNFGFEAQNGDLTLYFHGALEGRKIDVLKKTPQVCFEFDRGHELIRAATASAHSFRYESVIGTGRVKFINDTDEKRHALKKLMLHMAGSDDFTFSENELARVAVFKVQAVEFSAKRHP